MKTSMESTHELAMVDGVPTRLWAGMTANGIKFLAYIAKIRVDADVDVREFERELRATGAPIGGPRVLVAPAHGVTHSPSCQTPTVDVFGCDCTAFVAARPCTGPGTDVACGEPSTHVARLRREDWFVCPLHALESMERGASLASLRRWFRANGLSLPRLDLRDPGSTRRRNGRHT